ncbi:bcl-2 homologous antagonist/killer-like [Anneissia japonica]|uniref:bcl-2 homologous antagonist/killer-like n=1 Tax=Anneissia japonica TaxID=1529436 RepID=UPI001425627C|nr:bcl-2 homologous antagonist/killer-like [Anneissia japonica]XP_033101808.1 bcl-2 homologous antagonist/killer-like [Anneissia japonica]XP_033101809.1 bcl-2 homologous antagonist/killer-like [Anneissia japonica]XP_033101810.1 bcl-2 homologous antagonist/killer-like [Anneissia japonica]
MASPSGRSSTTTVVEDDSSETEANVSEQAEGIIRSFMSQRLHMALNNEEEDVIVATPSLAEFTVPGDPFSASTNIGRRLAQMGDQIDSQYREEFRQMISNLHITPATAYQAFAGVARRLFCEGINWGRIVALLMFGYRIAIDVARNASHFIKNIIQTLVKFIISEKIAKWIADQGGWISALSYQMEQSSWEAIGLVSGLAALSVIAVIYISRR